MSRGVNSMQSVGGCIMRRRARNNKNTQSTGELKQFSVKQYYILQSDRQQRIYRQFFTSFGTLNIEIMDGLNSHIDSYKCCLLLFVEIYLQEEGEGGS